MRALEPVVTILLPCRLPNRDYFQQALTSVASQSRSSWRLIVIVDDETDRRSAMHALADVTLVSDPRVSVVRQNSKLLTGALNTGMRLARTPYVCTLHCDDLLDRAAIEVLERSIGDFPAVDFFHSSRRIIDDSGNPISRVYPAKQSVTLEDFDRSGPVKHLLCWKVASAIAMGGLDETLGVHGADDYDFPWCMMEAGYHFRAIPECLYIYRDHRQSHRLTTHVPLDAQIDALKSIWRKHGLNENVIARQIERRTAGYLRQALFINEKDCREKMDANHDLRDGWRCEYP